MYRKFYHKKKKKDNFEIKKKSDIFHISAQNIDCGYSLEPPRPRQVKLAKIATPSVQVESC